MKLIDRFTTRLETCVTREWQRRGVFAWALMPLAGLFGLVTFIRRASFKLGWAKQQRIGTPVVIVGNVTVGGTGKTPVVIALVETLRMAGFTPGVITRGHGAKITAPLAVTPLSNAAQTGDEPLLIAQRTHAPVWACPDRVAAARALCAAHPEVNVIVSDDGLQHYRLGRDVELVVFDQRLAGNGLLLPAGPLREPCSRRREATLINSPYAPRTLPPNTFALKLIPGNAWRLIDPNQRKPLSQFAGQQVLAAAGIGMPERFFTTLRSAGLAPATYALPDHYAFQEDVFANVHADTILVTEKDAVKLRHWPDARIWVVPVHVELPARFIALVVEKLRGRPSA